MDCWKGHTANLLNWVNVYFVYAACRDESYSSLALFWASAHWPDLRTNTSNAAFDLQNKVNEIIQHAHCLLNVTLTLSPNINSARR